MKLLLALAIIPLLLSAAHPQAQVVIQNVTVIDMKSPTLKSGMTVIVDAGRIAAIGRRSKVPRGATV